MSSTVQSNSSTISEIPVEKESKTAVIVVLVIFVIGFLLYIGFIVLCWFKGWFIFGPYSPGPAPDNTFYPQGKITPYTPEQLERNKKLLTCLQKNGIDNFDKLCVQPIVGDTLAKQAKELEIDYSFA